MDDIFALGGCRQYAHNMLEALNHCYLNIQITKAHESGFPLQLLDVKIRRKDGPLIRYAFHKATWTR